MKHLGSLCLVFACVGELAVCDANAADRIEISGVGIAPESITSTSRGTIFIGSATRKIYRAQAGKHSATPWIDAPGDGPPSIFGVFADELAGVLWACAGSVPATTSELYAFDLDGGRLKARYPLPTKGGICNDIAVANDGTVFVTDSTHMQVLRLRKGAQALEIWAGTAPGTFGEPNGIIDGIAILGNRVIVNTLITRKLFGIEVRADGAAAAVTEMLLDRELQGPDGMRSLGDTALLVAETGGKGRLAHVAVNGNKASVRTIEHEFERGAVAVTIVGAIAYVLESRPIETAKQGEAARFEAVRVALP